VSAHGADKRLCPDPYCFVPRHVYGDYIASLIQQLLSDPNVKPRLTIIQGECVQACESASDVTTILAHGPRFVGDVAILATGHDMPTPTFPCYDDPWVSPSATGIDRQATVLIFGTGLTMVDYVLALLRDGQEAPIIAMSRRGLLSRAHRRVEALRIEEADVSFGVPASQLLRWFRQRLDPHVENGGDWRSVVDALRPFTQRLWRELPLASKRGFLEHARAWWDIHRHRMAPEVETRVSNAIAVGKLVLLAAKMVEVEINTGGALVYYRRRGRLEIDRLQVGTIVTCSIRAWFASTHCISVSRSGPIAQSSVSAVSPRGAYSQSAR
jgi:uncharacterized NAD(P)/FAD-binding protein YdhS